MTCAPHSALQCVLAYDPRTATFTQFGVLAAARVVVVPRLATRVCWLGRLANWHCRTTFRSTSSCGGWRRWSRPARWVGSSRLLVGQLAGIAGLMVSRRWWCASPLRQLVCATAASSPRGVQCVSVGQQEGERRCDEVKARVATPVQYCPSGAHAWWCWPAGLPARVPIGMSRSLTCMHALHAPSFPPPKGTLEHTQHAPPHAGARPMH